MGAQTTIAWTDRTFNPWWGCEKVSAGCTNCYAEAFAKRVGNRVWGKGVPRRFFGEKHWREPVTWNYAAIEAGVRLRVFCASMADVFEDAPELESQRRRLWGTIEATPNLDWQLLTKRPENIAAMYPWADVSRENVWLGTSVEDQAAANRRLPDVIDCTARPGVRFLSCEPLLGPVDLSVALAHPPVVNWVIVGGESGPKARPCDVAWIRSIVAQCKAAGVACFVKQLGARPRERLDGVEDPLVERHRFRFRDAKGSDPAEWPADLRVQEFPEVVR